LIRSNNIGSDGLDAMTFFPLNGRFALGQANAFSSFIGRGFVYHIPKIQEVKVNNLHYGRGDWFSGNVEA
jgi:hypothetical protein